MNRTVRTALADVEAVLFVIDSSGWKSDDELVLKLLNPEAKNVILVLNKIDLLKDKERLLPLMAESMQKFPFAAIVPVSAEKGKMLEDLKGEIKSCCPSRARTLIRTFTPTSRRALWPPKRSVKRLFASWATSCPTAWRS